MDWGLLFVQGTSSRTCGLPVHRASYPDRGFLTMQGTPGLVHWGLLFVHGPPDWPGASSLYKGLPSGLGPMSVQDISHLDLWPACTWGLLSRLGSRLCKETPSLAGAGLLLRKGLSAEMWPAICLCVCLLGF